MLKLGRDQRRRRRRGGQSAGPRMPRRRPGRTHKKLKLSEVVTCQRATSWRGRWRRREWGRYWSLTLTSMSSPESVFTWGQISAGNSPYICQIGPIHMYNCVLLPRLADPLARAGNSSHGDKGLNGICLVLPYPPEYIFPH